MFAVDLVLFFRVNFGVFSQGKTTTGVKFRHIFTKTFQFRSRQQKILLPILFILSRKM